MKIKPDILLIFLVSQLVAYSAYSNTNKKEAGLLSVENALERNWVSVTFTGNGLYKGECVDMTIKNLTGFDTTIWVEAGRRLTSVDTNEQDILVVRALFVELKSMEQKTVPLFGFCAQSHKSAPLEGAVFNVGYMEEEPVIKLAEYIDANRNLPLSAVQHAVWTMTNDVPVASVHDDDKDNFTAIKDLQKLIAGLKGLKIDHFWYSLEYKKDTNLFSGIPLTLHGEIEYVLHQDGFASLYVYNKYGIVKKVLFENVRHSQQKYGYNFRLNVHEWPKGKYYIRLMFENQMKLLREFEL